MELTPTELIAILAIITGFLTTIINIIVRYFEKKSDRDFKARRKAEDYYHPLYGHIAILHELVTGYFRSLKTGKTKIFSFTECKYKESTSIEILGDFKKSYNEFTSFYINRKHEGYELFVSEKLRNKLIDFWNTVESLHENNEKMKDENEINNFDKLAKEITEVMENLYGLK